MRPHGIRVVCLSIGGADELRRPAGRNNPNKLYAEDIAETIMAALNMPRRVLWPSWRSSRITRGRKA